MIQPYPWWDDQWDEETKALAIELSDLGDRWQELQEERGQVNARRKEIYLALDGKLTHRVIAEIGATTKGAVEQALNKLRRRNGK